MALYSTEYSLSLRTDCKGLGADSAFQVYGCHWVFGWTENFVIRMMRKSSG